MRFDDQSQIRDGKPVITMKLTIFCSLHPIQIVQPTLRQAHTTHARRQPIKMTTQASDTCYSTTDHWWAFQLIKQKAAEWHQTLCVAAIELKNALGTVEHSSSWRALCEEVRSHTYRCSHTYYRTLTFGNTQFDAYTHKSMLSSRSNFAVIPSMSMSIQFFSRVLESTHGVLILRR